VLLLNVFDVFFDWSQVNSHVSLIMCRRPVKQYSCWPWKAGLSSALGRTSGGVLTTLKLRKPFAAGYPRLESRLPGWDTRRKIKYNR